METKKSQKGFTLVELLVVIGILAVLLAIALVAINPARQFSQANNTKRRSDTNTLLNAISQYMADSNGAVPPGIPTTAQNISSTGANICSSLVTDYIAALPEDPGLGGDDITDCGSTYDTGYQVVQTTDNRITVSAPDAELEATISVTR